MMKIYKEVLPMRAEFSLVLPRGAMILDVQVQSGSPVIWFMFGTEAPHKETRHFRMESTGNGFELPPSPAVLKYLGTFQEGIFVGHLFEVVKP